MRNQDCTFRTCTIQAKAARPSHFPEALLIAYGRPCLNNNTYAAMWTTPHNTNGEDIHSRTTRGLQPRRPIRQLCPISVFGSSYVAHLLIHGHAIRHSWYW